MKREAEYETCECCGVRRLVRQESFLCQCCGKELDMQKLHTEYLDATVFYHGGAADHVYVCGVKCFMRWLRAFKPPANYNFISFPLLSGRSKLREFMTFVKAR